VAPRRYLALILGVALIATACGTTQSPSEAQTAPVNAATVTTAPTAPTAKGTVPTTTEAAPVATTIEAAPEASTTAAPVSDLAVPDGYPVPLPPDGDITSVTEEIENDYGTDQLTTRLEVWYDGDRFEEFVVFYASWIVDNGNTVLDARADETLASFGGYLPPDNDTYGVTVGIIGGSTLVQTLWGRPPG